METISIYILPIAKWLMASALLMVLYHLIYKERGSYNTNRIILLSIPIVAILLSVFRIEIFTPEPLYITLTEIPNTSISIGNEASLNTNIEEQSEGISLHIWLIILYLAGVVIQTLRTVMSHHRVMKLKMGKARCINNRITIIRNKKVRSPFSYCNTIFIPNELNGDKLRIVLKHEFEHIRNKHHIDLWILEILCTTLWFNPILILIRKELKKVHEFQADKGVLLHGKNIALYQKHLLEVFTQNRLNLVNEFNSSTIKQRFMEMKNTKRGSIKFVGKALNCVATTMIFAVNSFAIGEQQTIITIEDKSSQLEIKNHDTTNVATDNNDICVVGVSSKKLEQPYQIPATIQSNLNDIAKDSIVSVVGLSGNNIKGNPLYIVDGVIYESYNIDKLDPNKIENISILKKEQTTVFGEKGASGVIVITTKKETPKQEVTTSLLAKIITLDNTLNIDSTIFIIGEPTTQKVTKHDLKWIQETTNKPSLYLINNRVYSVNLLTEMFNHIDESQITGITILKDNAAVNTFGVTPGTHVVMIDYNGKIDDQKVFASFDSQNYFGARILNKWGKKSVKQIHKKANPKHI